MAGLLCCVSETGPFKEEGLTLDRLPKATDDCAVVPCLFDEGEGRLQFAREYPWQLQGIITQHGEAAAARGAHGGARTPADFACCVLRACGCSA